MVIKVNDLRRDIACYVAGSSTLIYLVCAAAATTAACIYEALRDKLKSTNRALVHVSKAKRNYMYVCLTVQEMSSSLRRIGCTVAITEF